MQINMQAVHALLATAFLANAKGPSKRSIARHKAYRELPNPTLDVVFIEHARKRARRWKVSHGVSMALAPYHIKEKVMIVQQHGGGWR